MKETFKNHTEPINFEEQLKEYCLKFAEHPLFGAAAENKIPLNHLKEFAFHQYSDSILWIPMLALMKQKIVRSARLRKSIEDNICCEAGVGGVSHIELARLLMRSIGITDLNVGPLYDTNTFAKSASMWLSNDFNKFNEPEVAGWLLVAETLVPIMFQKMLPAYQKIAGCDIKYFTEHIGVDCEEHSVWMHESLYDVYRLYSKEDQHAKWSVVPNVHEQILAGMKDAFEETLEIPNEFWHRLCQMRKVLGDNFVEMERV